MGDFGFYNSQENSNHDTMNYTIYLCMFRKELGRGSAFIRGAATKPMSFLLTEWTEISDCYKNPNQFNYALYLFPIEANEYGKASSDSLTTNYITIPYII